MVNGSDMRSIAVILVLILKVLQVENRMLQENYKLENTDESETNSPLPVDEPDETVYEAAKRALKIAEARIRGEDNINEKVIGLKSSEDKSEDDYGYDSNETTQPEKKKESCAVVVLSNSQNPSTQSLLRKYRYDANGALIPSSVKYFIKVPQEIGTAPLLVPLNDKAFSPLGGFVRYYKEIPPIPQAW